MSVLSMNIPVIILFLFMQFPEINTSISQPYVAFSRKKTWETGIIVCRQADLTQIKCVVLRDEAELSYHHCRRDHLWKTHREGYPAVGRQWANESSLFGTKWSLWWFHCSMQQAVNTDDNAHLRGWKLLEFLVQPLAKSKCHLQASLQRSSQQVNDINDGCITFRWGGFRTLDWFLSHAWYPPTKQYLQNWHSHRPLSNLTA